jgi:hypothetical protein
MDMGSYSFYYGDGGSKKRAAALGPVDVLIIHDTFTALGTGVLAGWTPDTVNTPGGTWTDSASRFKGNGAGALTHTVNNAAAQKDTGITNNKMRVEIEVNCATSKTNLFIAILASSTFSGFGNEDGIYIQHDSAGDGDTLRLFATAGTQIANAVVPRTVGVTHKYSLEYDGADLIVHFDDVEVAALRQVGYGIPVGQDGQSYIGLMSTGGSSGVEADNLKVWQLP